MKKIILPVILIIFMCQLFSEDYTGNIAGEVIAADSQLGLDNTTVIVDKTYRTITNEQGKYLLRDIPIGSHKISFKRIGYKTYTKTNIKVKPNETTVINVSLGVKTIKIAGISVKDEQYFKETEEAPVSSQSLDIEEIKTQPSGSYDIQRSVQALPSVVSGTDSQNEIIVRGGHYGENLFLMDNIEISNPNHFGRPGMGGGPVSMITPEFVKKVDFYAGAFPARYGNKASSVLDMRVREGNHNNFKLKADLGMAGYGGIIEGPILGKENSYLLSYHRSFLSLLTESIGLSAVPNYHSVIGKQVFQFSPYTELTINQLWGRDWIDIEHDVESGYASQAGKSDVYARSGQYTIGATLKKIYHKSYSLLTLFRNHNWWRENVYEAGTKADSTKNWFQDTDRNINKLKYRHVIPKSSFGKVEAGFSFNYDQNKTKQYMKPDTLFVYDAEDTIVDTLTDENGDPIVHALAEDNRIEKELNTQKAGGYLQTANSFGNFELTLGVRGDYFRYNKNSTFAPRAGLKYRLTEDKAVNFGYGRHFQNPCYYLLMDNQAENKLKPKYTDQVILGYEHLLQEDIKLSVETYYKKYNDVPISYEFTTADTIDWTMEYVNEGEGYSRGIEFFLQKKLKDKFWGTLSYSYSTAKAYDPREGDKYETYSWDFDFQHVFTGILGYKIQFFEYDWYDNNRHWLRWGSFTGIFPSDETEISIKYQYKGGRPYTEMSYIPALKKWYIPANQPINNKRFPAYQRLDLHINHCWFESNYNIISYLEFDNIFNHKNIWDYNYLEDGTTEKTYQWGRMIVGGVMVEF